MHGTIKLIRRWQYKNSRRAYSVFIDDAKVGVINNDEKIEFSVNAGIHSVQVRIDWCRSKKAQVQIREGETVPLQIYTRGLRDWQTWLAWGFAFILFSMGALTRNLVSWIVFGVCGLVVLATVISTPYLKAGGDS
jgi:hypothetical protein